MIFDTRITYNGSKIRIRGATFRRFQNVRILQAGIEAIKFRLQKGFDSNDAKAKPLKKAYAIRKSKLTHRRAIRDMDLTGQTLGELKPRYSDDTTAIGDTSTHRGRMIMRINRDMFIFSDSDQALMQRTATKIFKEEIAPGSFASVRPSAGRFVARKLQSRLAA
jgi:hypothetical protein